MKLAEVSDLAGNRHMVDAESLVAVRPAADGNGTVLEFANSGQMTIQARYEDVKAMLERLQ